MTKLGTFAFGCCAAFALLTLAGCSKESGSTGATNVAPMKPVPTDPLLDARRVTDAYLEAVRIIEVPEGKDALARHSWSSRFPVFAPRDPPFIKEASTLFDGLFDTDVPGVKGYRRLLRASVITTGQTEGETSREEADAASGSVSERKYLAVAYRDAVARNWMVFALLPARDTAEEIAALRASINEAEFPESEIRRYVSLAYNLILDGQLGEARKVIDQAKRLPSVSTVDDELIRNMQTLGVDSAQVAELRQTFRSSAARREKSITQLEGFISAVTAK